jgi:hypothetical protein
MFSITVCPEFSQRYMAGLLLGFGTTREEKDDYRKK